MLEFLNNSGQEIDDELLESCEKAFFAVLKTEKENWDENLVSAAVNFVTNDEIRKLNKKFRKIDKETDVLSFVAEEDYSEPEEEIYLGDIIISFEKAIEQANSMGHTLKRELGFLVAHSTLHLLGYDHMTETEEQIMINKQEEALKKIGLYRL